MAADLRTFRPGDKLHIPYELTVSESVQDFWQSVRQPTCDLLCVASNYIIYARMCIMYPS